ncbi:DoxX family membrane protein [Streptomyces sp. NBC_01803]|uniref:DoxX family membrane protein n=1 Tax=Streptomyces sp. NBC_01803 TaxID=2975946 RepID=UPI002DD934A4|nr:DoxX family membrane protein [Streptomyces sp. NBC_01803]WSA44830.1 DoxX family membrane protein [Streptomyces sp. NBC_01803]
MSVDTKTPRGLSIDEPVLSTVKVPCDPAQVIVNHASFRVRLATPPPVSIAVSDTATLTRVPAAAARRRPLVWSGRSAPGDPGATMLLEAVREAGHTPGTDAFSTQVLPRVGTDAGPPAVIAPRSPQGPETTQLLPSIAPEPAEERPRAADGRQAYHPGRHLSLGVVLLPLRVLLGFIAIYAGMGKLTDPVYFDGGERGSLYTWLDTLQPWTAAAPLHEWALSHPVGAGLTVAFTQIIVGVLTIFGLWQRLAAGLGALLSLALLVTVSWGNGPAYDTPDIILAAAWSPLLIAGAPVFSLDARLAGEAWRRLGPRAPLPDLRRRVLRRGAVLATLLLGCALLIGSLLGSAVRSSQFVTVPEPGEPPRNHRLGQPLPEEAEEDGEDTAERSEEGSVTEEPDAPREAAEEAEPGADPDAETGAATDGPRQQVPPTEQTVPAPQQPSSPEQSVPVEVPPASPPGAGNAGEPVEESPTDDGGDRSSLSPIGGLLG